MMSATRLTMTAAAIFVAAAAIVYLAVFDPTSVPAPKCVFHLLTGFDCPGCGSQRAIHALAHGQIARAWSYNPALFFAIPLAALYAWSPQRLYRIMYARITLLSLVGAILAWWILRNV